MSPKLALSALVGALSLSACYYVPYGYYPAYPAYPEPVYAPAPAYQPQTQLTVAPPVPREACYEGGCYRLYGDGVTSAYQWVWVPVAPPPPPGPPSR